MNWQKILSRISDPGFLLVALGAIAAYCLAWIVRRVPESKREKAKLAVKAAGCVLALIGAILLFT